LTAPVTTTVTPPPARRARACATTGRGC
jgi:hypothetical protein